jgi:hypothetical protein
MDQFTQAAEKLVFIAPLLPWIGMAITVVVVTVWSHIVGKE